MTARAAAALALLLAPGAAPAQAQQGPRVYISADMEGTAGVVDFDEIRTTGADYEHARRLMLAEVNAAIQGAFDGGASAVLVNDSHGTHRNLLPEELDPRAELIRGRPKQTGMMEGLDAGFDAVVLTGYHARASTADAIVDHTWTTRILSARVNGREVGELGLNTLVAAHFGVPVVFVSGDSALAVEAREWVPGIDVAVVKTAVGRTAARSIHPERARDLIRRGVAAAVADIDEGAVPSVTAPVHLDLELTNTAEADALMRMPGIARTGPRSVSYTAPDPLTAFRVVRFLSEVIRGV